MAGCPAKPLDQRASSTLKQIFLGVVGMCVEDLQVSEEDQRPLISVAGAYLYRKE